MDIGSAREKKEKLISILKEKPSLLIAFSGGVDSSFLLAVAYEILKDHVTAATGDSITFPSRERLKSIEFAGKLGVEHIIFKSDESAIPEFTANGADRCYYCKKALSKELIQIAKERGIKYIAFAANIDDLKDYRPGIEAAKEMGVISPLIEVKLGKEEIRLLSKEMGLPTWDKPAMACLASRIPYGESVTEEKLDMVQKAELFLRENGFKQCRVRYYGNMARIEIESSKITMLLDKDLRKRIVDKFREIGFSHIALDLEGYITGSLNRGLIDILKELEGKHMSTLWPPNTHY